MAKSSIEWDIENLRKDIKRRRAILKRIFAPDVEDKAKQKIKELSRQLSILEKAKG